METKTIMEYKAPLKYLFVGILLLIATLIFIFSINSEKNILYILLMIGFALLTGAIGGCMCWLYFKGERYNIVVENDKITYTNKKDGSINHIMRSDIIGVEDRFSYEQMFIIKTEEKEYHIEQDWLKSKDRKQLYNIFKEWGLIKERQIESL